MTERKPKARYVVTLEGPAGAERAYVHALRYLLKHALRSYGLRCTEIRQIDCRDDDGGTRC